MAYTKIVFQNSPSTATPLNAENLNHMDDQIALNDQRLTEIETSYVKSFKGRKGEVVPEYGDYNIGQIAPLTGAQVGQVPVVVNHGTEQDPELVFEMGAGGGGGHSIIDSEGSTMPQEDKMQFVGLSVSDDSENGKTIIEHNINNDTPTFTEASTRANIASGESISTLFGKIKKFFTDIKDLAFIAKDGTSSTKYLRGDGTWQAFSKSTVGLGNVDNTADNNKPVPIVECSTARSTANKVVALTGFTLKTGSRVYVRFTDTGTSNPASGNLTLNVNSTGAKTIVDGKTNKSVLTYSSAGWFYNNIVSEFVYDGTYWVWMSRDNNTTYTPQALGLGYATCSTAAATAAKVATLSGYSLVTNGIVSVKFTNSVPANATLNINNRGAKNIYYQGAKIVAGVIKAGDIATFVYSGNYNLICIDRGSAENVVYDNSQSGLSATKVQGAIDELKSGVTSVEQILDSIKTKQIVGFDNLSDVTPTINNCYHNGIIAELNITFLSTSAKTGWNKIAEVSPAPSVDRNIPLFNGSTNEAIGYCLIEASGDVKILNIPNNTYLTIVGSYFLI